MGRIIPSFRQLYEETIAELKSELQSAMIDLGHKSAFDLILKDAWNREQAAMGNSTPLDSLRQTQLNSVYT